MEEGGEGEEEEEERRGSESLSNSEERIKDNIKDGKDINGCAYNHSNKHKT